MSKREFLDNLRVARNLLTHARVTSDSRRLDPAALTRAITRAAIWLTPKAVEGFDESDFAELGPGPRSELVDAVRDFESVAHQVPANASANDTQVQEGGDALRKMIDILADYLPADEEERQIRDALATVDYPLWVRNWDFEPASNEDGEPSVWVTLYLDEGAVPQGLLGRHAIDVLPKIRAALKAAGVQRWPYVRLWTVHEYQTQP